MSTDLGPRCDCGHLLLVHSNRYEMSWVRGCGSTVGVPLSERCPCEVTLDPVASGRRTPVAVVEPSTHRTQPRPPSKPDQLDIFGGVA